MIRVERDGTELGDGATVTVGDKLTLIAEPEGGYEPVGPWEEKITLTEADFDGSVYTPKAPVFEKTYLPISNETPLFIDVASSAIFGDTVIISTKEMSGTKITRITVRPDGGGNIELTKEGEARYSFTMPAAAVVVSAQIEPDLHTDGGGAYLIGSAEEMTALSVAVDNGYNTSGKTYKMTADLSVSTEGGFLPIGNYKNRFKGTFDGNNHTLTVTLAGAYKEEFIAPFGYLENATIKNLTTAGTIHVSGKYAAGIVGKTETGKSILEKCISSVTIESTVNGDGTHGGLVAVANRGIEITNCGFTGAIIGGSTNSCGGLVGWADRLNDDDKTTISNSFVAGSFDLDQSRCYTFSRFKDNGEFLTIENCYYLNKLGDVNDGAVQLTADDFQSGKAAWLLNGPTSDGPWKQTRGTDAYPNFTGGTLYENSCVGRPFYSNTEGKSYDAHDYSDGVCTRCGAYKPLPQPSDGVYRIGNDAELFAFAEMVNGGAKDANAVLTADIDLKGKPWTTITETAFYGNDKGYGENLGYSGTFDGAGHTIRNFVLHNSASTPEFSLGLFGTVSGTVKNLGVENVTFTNSGGDVYAGAIAGQLIQGNGKISNCYVAHATIGAGDDIAGGIAGCVLDGTIENCLVYESNVKGNSIRCGQIVGDSRGNGSDKPGTVKNCYTDKTPAVGTVSGTIESTVGGIDLDRFKSGEIAYKLNSNTDIVWTQTIGTDQYPRFKTGDTDVTVYQGICVGNNVYNNTGSETFTEHSYKNGICTRCGTYEGPVKNPDGVYQINNAGQFFSFAEFVNKGNATSTAPVNAELTADIDLENRPWTPIRGVVNLESGWGYCGTFDGGGHTISNLYVFSSSTDGTGLFGAIGTTGVVQNVLCVSGSVTGGTYVGGVCGINRGTIKNCESAVTVSGGSEVGGVCGENRGTIEDCDNTGTVSGEYDVGGVCGYTSGGTITNCHNTGEVSGETEVGGVCGVNSESTIENCYNTGTVSGEYDVGGVCGGNETATIEDCYNTGKVSGVDSNVGGVCGANYYNGTITKCHNTGTVSGVNDVGGVCGVNFDNGTITNCHNIGEVSGVVAEVGGVCGRNAGSTIANCYNTGPVSGEMRVGGVCGVCGALDNGDDNIVPAYVENCYYLQQGTAMAAIGEGDEPTYSTYGKTADDFQYGSVTYLLQSRQETQVWGQAIGTDASPVLTGDTAKAVYKVLFKADNTLHAEKYANPTGLGDRMPEPPADKDTRAFYRWENESGEFTGSTPLTEDLTIDAVWREKYGEQEGAKTISTTYGTEVTQNLSKYMSYAEIGTAAERFTYSIDSKEERLRGENFTIDGDILTVSKETPAGEYDLTIKATEKTPQIALASAENYGTEPVTLAVKVRVAKAAAPVLPEKETSFNWWTGGSGSVDLAEAVNAYAPATAYTVRSTTGDIVENANVASDGKLSFTVNSGASGETAVIEVTVSFRNYEDAVLKVNATLTGENPIDTSALDAAIEAAASAKNGVAIHDGAASEATVGTKFVSSDVMSRFEAAIEAARQIKASATSAVQITDAADALNSAAGTFRSAIQTGTKPGEGAVVTGLSVNVSGGIENIQGTPLDVPGLVVTAVYSDGGSKPVTDYTIGGYDANSLGTQTVTVSYGGMTASFTVTVVEKKLTGVSITQKPAKLVYAYQEPLDTAGLKLTASYNDGSAGIVTGWSVSGYSETTPGTQTVTVSYGGFSAAFTVTVSENVSGGGVAKPVASITSFIGGKEIALSSSTPGAVIHYTVDGSVPGENSPRYENPIRLTGSCTVKALAIRNGAASSVSSMRISVPQVSAPAVYPGGGPVESGTVVTLRSDTAGSAIYYTTDGTDPVPNGQNTLEYQGSIVITESAKQIKAVAVKHGCVSSGVESFSYTVKARPTEEAVISLGSVSTDAGAVASIPVYVFSGNTISGCQITLNFEEAAFENAVTVTPAEGVDPSKFVSSVNGGTVTLLYTGGQVESDEICTVNLTSRASGANTTQKITVDLNASSVTGSAGTNLTLTAMNSTVKLGEAKIPQVSGDVAYTTAEGEDISSAGQIKGGSEIEASVSIDGGALDSGEQETFANVYLAVYDRSNRMVSVDTWKVNLSDPAFLFMQTIRIPQNVEVGSIKIMLLNDRMAPLMPASKL